MSKYNFAQLALDYGHPFGRIEDVMNVIYLSKKDSHLNTMQKFYICGGTKIDNQLNDKNTVSYNKIFEIILNLDSQLTQR
jgi:hypothetical protein